MSTNRSHDVVLEQRSDIKILMPILRDMALKSDAGISINLIGPIYVNNSQDGQTQEPFPALVVQDEIKKLRSGESTGIELPDKLVKKFEKIYDEIPCPKLDATLRLVAQTAYGKSGDVKSVAKELRCSHYKARDLLVKYGVMTS